jgi:endogenous inhibitor of DNA gyrase (YacG/DUF329 family)
MHAATRHMCPICGREAPPRSRSGGVASPDSAERGSAERGSAERGSAERGAGNPSFPFCSHACKLVDLGHWLDGSYRIAGPATESTLDGDDE